MFAKYNAVRLKNVYLTLFESHLSYGITAWGGISKNLLQPLFITQKKRIRVMFGIGGNNFKKWHLNLTGLF